MEQSIILWRYSYSTGTFSSTQFSLGRGITALASLLPWGSCLELLSVYRSPVVTFLCSHPCSINTTLVSISTKHHSEVSILGFPQSMNSYIMTEYLTTMTTESLRGLSYEDLMTRLQLLCGLVSYSKKKECLLSYYTQYYVLWVLSVHYKTHYHKKGHRKILNKL